MDSRIVFSSEAMGWETMMMDARPTPEEEKLVSPSSYMEAVEVFSTWQQEGQKHPIAAPPLEHDEDVIMQLGDDEGLLPVLQDCYGPNSTDIGSRVLLADIVHRRSSSDSFLATDEPCQEEQLFQETLRKLTESMRRSRETRSSLYVETPKLRDYQRLGSVKKVLKSIEASSGQIDSYCRSLANSV